MRDGKDSGEEKKTDERLISTITNSSEAFVMS